MKKTLLTIFGAIALSHSWAQQTEVPQMDAKVNALSTEEYNNNLTSYIKIVGNNLTSSKNGFQLKIALIAFKDSAKWDQAADYLKPVNRFLRYTQITAGVAHQKTYDDATMQVTFSLINRRDSSVYSYTNPVQETAILSILRKAWNQYYDLLISQGKTPQQADQLSGAAYNAEVAYITQKKHTTNPAAAEYINLVNQVSKGSTVFSGLSIDDAFKKWEKDFTNYAKQVSRKPILTFYPYASYDYTYSGFDKAGAGLTFLYSLDNNPDHDPLQLDIEANAYAGSDSLKKAPNMAARIISGSLGLNYAVTDDKGKSFFEVKLAADVQHNSESGVKQKTPDADLTLRWKLFKNLWIPLDIKYDSTRKGIFGYISITSNLGKF